MAFGTVCTHGILIGKKLGRGPPTHPPSLSRSQLLLCACSHSSEDDGTETWREKQAERQRDTDRQRRRQPEAGGEAKHK